MDDPAVLTRLAGRAASRSQTISAFLRAREAVSCNVLWRTWQQLGPIERLHMPRVDWTRASSEDVPVPWAALKHLSLDLYWPAARGPWHDILKVADYSSHLDSLQLSTFSICELVGYEGRPMPVDHLILSQSVNSSHEDDSAHLDALYPFPYQLDYIAQAISKFACNVSSLSLLHTYMGAPLLDELLRLLAPKLHSLHIMTSSSLKQAGRPRCTARYVFGDWDMQVFSACTQLRKLEIETVEDEPALSEVWLPPSLRVFRLSWIDRLDLVLLHLSPSWLRRHAFLSKISLTASTQLEIERDDRLLCRKLSYAQLQEFDAVCGEESIIMEPRSLLLWKLHAKE